MHPTSINMNRPALLYVSGLAVILALSVLMANVPLFALSSYWSIPYKREICAALFGIGALSGVFAMVKHIHRVRRPWSTPQSLVLFLYLCFFIPTLAAVVLAR